MQAFVWYRGTAENYKGRFGYIHSILCSHELFSDAVRSLFLTTLILSKVIGKIDKTHKKNNTIVLTNAAFSFLKFQFAFITC